jgi:hypothetical protein
VTTSEPSYVLRIDPWAAEYEGSIQIPDDAQPASVDTSVETGRWAGIHPSASSAAVRLAFVDGVRRIERRLLVEERGTTLFGLLGSYGVGAALVDGRARVAEARLQRVIVVGGGLLAEPFLVTVPNSCLALVFEPRVVAANTAVAAVDGLQAAMRTGEAALSAELAGAADVVFQDGPLSFLTAHSAGVVGLVKRLQRNYLDPAQHALLPHLAVGERTPLFLIGGAEARYSWYLRIAHGRAIESALAGIVRLETKAACGVEEARRLADLSAREIPRFASHGARDPRAPQNLYPVGGLEARLKHLLGDPLVVRRAIEAQLHSEVTA